MSHLFRSETMNYVRLTITNDASHDTMRELGNLGKFHLVDLNGDDAVATDTYYKKRVIACAFWERKLAQLEKEMAANAVPVPPAALITTEYKGGDLISDVKAFLDPIEQDLERNVEFKTAESRRVNELKERRIVLTTLKDAVALSAEVVPPPVTDVTYPYQLEDRMQEELKTPFLDVPDAEAAQAGKYEEKYPRIARIHNFLTGIVPVLQQPAFERMVFRISRGNAYVRFFNLPDAVADPMSGEVVQKSVYYVVYIGDVLKRRLTKVCEHLRATIYPVPASPAQYDQEVAGIDREVREKEEVLRATQGRIVAALNHLCWDPLRPRVSPLRDWQDALRRERHICDALRKCQVREASRLVIAEGWIPGDSFRELEDTARMAVRYSGAQPALVQVLRTRDPPPTYFRTTKVTSAYQALVNTYGVPRYKEVNPGLFTLVTFPFLFGVMYGDIGHGVFLFLFSLYLILKEDDLEKRRRNKTLGELPGMIFAGRYMLVAMGFFAIYCGTIYNDCLAVPINLFGSHWRDPKAAEIGPNGVPDKATLVWDGGVYPYGMDPNWFHTKNELSFFNSLKMKLSVTLGVTQMTFGIVLGVFNHLHAHDRVSIFLEWIPQLLFMLCTFGYMVFLIIYKFTVNWDQRGMNPPNLIQTMIKMFLSMGAVEKDAELYAGQETMQQLLLALALICLPWMLLAKPYMLKYLHNKRRRERAAGGAHRPLPVLAEERSDAALHDEHKDAHSELPLAAAAAGGDASERSVSGHAEHAEHEGGGHDDHGVDPDGEFPFGEFMIHQSIHTIEFVLGCVSNTASYLRLWALSLAHAELANVFWNKLIMEYGVVTGNPIMAVVGWAAWAGASFTVLLAMDVLECFLHALRLHWVEFQNKFFRADGYAFQPFTFEEKEED